VNAMAVVFYLIFWGYCGVALAQRRNRDTTQWAILVAIFPLNLLLLALLPTLAEQEGATVACAHCLAKNHGIERSRRSFECEECGRVTKFVGPASWPA